MITKKHYILFLIFVLLTQTTIHVYSQNPCTDSKLNKLKIIYNIDAWTKNFELIYSVDTTVAPFNPYLVEIMHSIFLDSACNFFTEEEIDEIFLLPFNEAFPKIEQYETLVKEAYNNTDYKFEDFIKKIYSNFDTTDVLVKRMMEFSMKAFDIAMYWEVDLAIYESGYLPNIGNRDYYMYNYEKSIAYFENKIRNESVESFENYYFIGLNLLALGRNDEAISFLRKAQSLSKFNSDADYQLAYFNFYTKYEADSALIEIHKALEKEPDNFLNILLLAKIYIEKEEFDKSINLCTKLSKSKNEEESIEALQLRGFNYIQKQDLLNAEKDYRLILKKDSNNISGLLGVSNTFLLKGQLDSSYYYANKSYILDNDNFLTITLLGDIYMTKGDYATSEELFAKALEFQENTVYLNNLGFCKMKLEKYLESIEIFNKVINEYEIDKANEMVIAFTYNNLGFCYYALGQLNKAFENINKSLELYPNNACAAINKALVFIENGDIEKSCEEFERAKDMMFLEHCGVDYEEIRRVNCN